MLIFFEHNHIPEKQQEKIIAELEAKHVNTILISNRKDSTQEGLGYFGRTHCQRLAGWIAENFRPLVTFGPWESDPVFNWNHAVTVWHRKP